jgi:hypothetical protein
MGDALRGSAGATRAGNTFLGTTGAVAARFAGGLS